MPSEDQHAPIKSLRTTSLWQRVRMVVVISSILGLGALNIATLVSDELHAAGYSVLRAVLGSGLADETLTKLLSRSTTAKRKSDVALATKTLMAEKSTLAATNRAILEKHLSLEKEHKDVVAKNLELTKVSSRQNEIVQKVNRRIAQRSVRGAGRNITSLSGEVLPFVGAALTVGVTAWDLYDLCETVKDLNEVNRAFGQPLDDEQAVCSLKVPSKEKVLADARSNWQLAYRTAADSINQAGNIMVVPKPPSVSFSDMKSVVCPVIGATTPICK